MNPIDQILKDEAPERAASIKAHNEKPINWNSSFIARDLEGKPLVCGCGFPVENNFPWPTYIPLRSCYACTMEFLKEQGHIMPVELKPGETRNPPVMGQQMVRE